MSASRTIARGDLSAGWSTALVAGAALLVALVLWGLAGFHRIPSYEGWVIFAGFARGAHGWWLTPNGGAFAGNSLRPLEVLPHQIAYSLSFGSFVAFNLVSMAAFVVRACAAYVVTRELLPGSRAVAFAAGLIFALSPVADGAMLDRTIHVQWSGALLMAGFATVLIAVRTSRVRWAVVSALCVASAVLMYEAGLPAAVLIIGFVIARLGRGERRAALRLTAISALGLVTAVAYLLIARTQARSATYQDIGCSNSPPAVR